MCSCGKKNGQTASRPRSYGAPTQTTQEFALVKRDGATIKFGSRLEADAENARTGFQGIVKPVGS